VRPRYILLAALVVVVVPISLAHAGPAAKKQRVAINVKIMPDETFVLKPLQPGRVKRDSGTLEGAGDRAGPTSVRKSGQKVSVHSNDWILLGKQGSLTIRERIEWVEIGSDANRDGERDLVGRATWKVIRGTGTYARLSGGGGAGHLGLGDVWYARFEGFLVSR
jgi:hypothetical protein